METAIGIENAFNEEYTHMRRSLLPRLLLSLASNEKHDEKFGLFELGNVYIKTYRDRTPDDLQTPFVQKKQL